jgi:sporulation protein YlmC with PRC-barrel domain
MISDDRLIKTRAILGSAVLDGDGHKLGVVRELFVDQRTGSIAFAILEPGGLFGSGGKFHPVPWRLLRAHPDGESWLAAFDRDRFKGSPAYDREQLNSTTYGWGAQTLRYFEADGADGPQTVSVVTNQVAPH